MSRPALVAPSVLAAALLAGAPAFADPVPAPELPDAPLVADSTAAVGADAAPPAYVMDPVRVRGRVDDLLGSAASASEGRTGREDLAPRPLVREGEILETVPGLILTQHSGDGKSNQMFLRGFNLDHGTDFSTSVEGMPLNLPTHGHGQGYTDLNFLIPELVDHVDFKKGVYYADLGDFGSAGGADIRFARMLDRPFLKGEIGQHGYVRTVAAGSKAVGGGALLLGAELKGYDGPWSRPQDLDKASGLARYSWRTRGGDDLSVLALGYRNDWNASDQVPLRAVTDGGIGEFGQVDTTLGGETTRGSVALQWRRADDERETRAELWAADYSMNLFSDFTYFLEDSAQGDQFEQLDDRTMLGGTLRAARPFAALGTPHRVTAGVQTRADFIHEVGLFRTEARQRVGTVRQDRVVQASGALHAEVASRWTTRLRTTAGLRGDVYRFDVTSRTIPGNSGAETDAIVSPKLGAAFAVTSALELYANAGLGFHSNDARGATIAIDPATGEPATPVDPLVRSRGAELGLRFQPLPGWRSTVSAWALELDSELVFVGDGGTTEPVGGSRRRGVEFANFWEISRRFAADVDVALSRGRFEDTAPGEDHIPGALESVVAAGLRWEDPSGFHAAARLRHFGAYPLIEDDSVRADPTTLVNAGAGFRFSGIGIDVAVLNVLDEAARDIQYFYASRLPGEPADGVEDVHYHPVEPRQVRVGLSAAF